MKANMKIEDIRRDNLNTLVVERGGKGALVQIASDCDVSAAYLSQILTRSKMGNGKVREVGSKLARKLEIGCKKPSGWMDVYHSTDTANENELVALYNSLNQNLRDVLLEQAKLLSKLDK